MPKQHESGEAWLVNAAVKLHMTVNLELPKYLRDEENTETRELARIIIEEMNREGKDESDVDLVITNIVLLIAARVDSFWASGQAW